MNRPRLSIKTRDDFEMEGYESPYGNNDYAILSSEHYSFSSPYNGEKQFWEAVANGANRVLAEGVWE